MEKSNRYIGTLAASVLFAAVFSGAYLSPLFGRPAPFRSDVGTASLLEHTAQDREEAFPAPVPAHWRADVIGVLEGGQAYAFERIDDPGEGLFYGFFDEMPADMPDGYGTVHGLWLGTTCAYRNTVFRGRCVPEVRIRSFEPLGDELPQ